MKFNYNKLFSGGKKKDLLMGIEELGRVFTGNNSGSDYSWATGAQLQQYSKSLYVFAAVNKIAIKAASVEVKLYKLTNTEGDSEEVLSHEILDLLNKVNPFQTRTEFLRIAFINKKLTGEAFWLKVRDTGGKVVELWNLRPDMMTVVADPTTYVKYYEFKKSDGAAERFAPEDIIHFKDPDPLNMFRGLSPLRVCQTRVETEQAANEYQRTFFRNNARPDALLLTAESLDKDQRDQMLGAWEDRHSGEEGNSKLGILEGGMTYQQVSMSQKEMDYIESLKFTRDDILVAFGVPKSVIVSDSSSYANADTAMRSFLSEVIVPEMQQMVEVLDEFLVIPDFGEEYYLDFIDPTPADRESQRADSTAGFGKWLTTNEIRATYNLPPIEGGDEIAQLQPAIPGLAAGDTQQAALKTKMRAKALKALQKRPGLKLKKEMIAHIKSLVTKSLSPAQITKALKQAGSIKEESVLVPMLATDTIKQMHFDVTNKRIDKRANRFKKELIAEFEAQYKRVVAGLKTLPTGKGKTAKVKASAADISSVLNVKEEIKLFAAFALPFMLDMAEQGGKDTASMLNEDFSMTTQLKKAMEKRSRFFAISVNNTTFQQLTDTLTAGLDAGEGIGALTERVQDVYGAIPEWRANMIARTEATNANNEGTLERYRGSAVVKGKEWVATMDDRVRDEHAALNGEIVLVDEKFSNGEAYPQDINCRCVLAPAMYSSKTSIAPAKKNKSSTAASA